MKDIGKYQVNKNHNFSSFIDDSETRYVCRIPGQSCAAGLPARHCDREVKPGTQRYLLTYSVYIQSHSPSSSEIIKLKNICQIIYMLFTFIL